MMVWMTQTRLPIELPDTREATAKESRFASTSALAACAVEVAVEFKVVSVIAVARCSCYLELRSVLSRYVPGSISSSTGGYLYLGNAVG